MSKYQTDQSLPELSKIAFVCIPHSVRTFLTKSHLCFTFKIQLKNNSEVWKHVNIVKCEF